MLDCSRIGGRIPFLVLVIKYSGSSPIVSGLRLLSFLTMVKTLYSLDITFQVSV